MKSYCGFLAALLTFLIGVPEAYSEVKRNAGRSHFGGMGLDLNWYCEYRYGEDSGAVALSSEATGWRCVRGSQLVGISMTDACRTHYGNTANAYLGPEERATDWYCILGLNLSWYCQQIYGSASKAVKLFPNDDSSWKCQVAGNYYQISMTNACRRHYGSGAFARLGILDDPRVWNCQI